MSDIYVAEAALIDAAPQAVYDLLRDYHAGHPSILPKAYFPKLEVQSGGLGAGTKFRVTTRAMGVERFYNMHVTETGPGWKLIETDAEAGLVTTFEVEAVGDRQARLTIATRSKASPGLRGLVERLTLPPVMRRIYKVELGLIVAHFASRVAATPL